MARHGEVSDLPRPGAAAWGMSRNRSPGSPSGVSCGPWRGEAGTSLAMNERHLRRVLASECAPGVEPDAALVRRLSRRSYQAYGRYWLDGARLPYTSPRSYGGG